MSKSRKITDVQRNVAQWHRDKAIRFWLAGKWDLYTRHIRIADSFARR
jgi:hypothetical protein